VWKFDQFPVTFCYSELNQFHKKKFSRKIFQNFTLCATEMEKAPFFQVKYTSYPELAKEERRKKFETNCLEGYTEISISSTGLVLILAWNPKCSNGSSRHHTRSNYGSDFVKEPGKVHITAPFILNGVCVRWQGWIDLQKLEGIGSLEFDLEAAKLEESVMKKQVQIYNECTLGPG